MATLTIIQSGETKTLSVNTGVGPAGSDASVTQANITAAITDDAQFRTDIGLGTLATQSGTFSGTSSGTNTGDQDLSGYLLKSGGTMTGAMTIGNGSSVTFDNLTSAVFTSGSSSYMRFESSTYAVFASGSYLNINPGSIVDYGGGAMQMSSEKTTPLDADYIPLADTASSNAVKKLTFANLAAYIVGVGRTLAGSWDFSSTTRPTSAGTGHPTGTSLMTRDDVANRRRFARLSADATVNSTVAPTTIASLSVVNGRRYIIKARISITGTANTGTRHGITLPTGTTRLMRLRASSYSPVKVSGSHELGLAETSTIAEYTGYYVCAADGNVITTFAQNTSHADNTTADTYSYLELTEVS